MPWALWQAYRDRRVLEDQYDSMAARPAGRSSRMPVVDWMHRTIGGIAPLEPGYRGSASRTVS